MYLNDAIACKFMKFGQRVYSRFLGMPYTDSELMNLNDTNTLITNAIKADSPFLISRLGHFESEAVFNSYGLVRNSLNLFSVIKNDAPLPCWDPSLLKHLFANVGLFPIEKKVLEDFCTLYENEMSSIDILGSWLKIEQKFKTKLNGATYVKLHNLEPFFSDTPWTLALKGKKVLVVHPFADSIKQQFVKKNSIFPNGLLPDFQLYVVPAVQSINATDDRFQDWFEALEFMKEQIDKINYDVCIIGAGGYGLPLGAHVKRQGKIAIHLGGVTQMLFGIKGSRWEQFMAPPYYRLFNEFWVKPDAKERPAKAEDVENACYW